MSLSKRTKCAVIKSPTCALCAKKAGLVPVTPFHTVHMGVCANCGETKGVSTADDWKKIGEVRYDWD